MGKAISNVKKSKLIMPTRAVYIPDSLKCLEGRLVKKDQLILSKPFDIISINSTARTSNPIPVHKRAKNLNRLSCSLAELKRCFLVILLPEFFNNPITDIIQNKCEYEQR